MKNNNKNIFKKQKITIIILSLLLSISVFAQTEQITGNENKSAESSFPEIEKSLSNNDDEEICQIEGDRCWTRKELLLEITEKKNSDFVGYYLPKVYFLLGDYKSLFALCNQENTRTGNANCTLYRGFPYLKTGKFEEALNDFWNSGVNNALTQFDLSEIYRQKLNFGEAFIRYNRALEKNYRFSKAYYGRGTIYLKRGKDLLNAENFSLAEIELKNALKSFNSVIEIDLNRTTPETYRQRANVYELLGDDFHAEADRVLAKELSEKEQIKK